MPSDTLAGFYKEQGFNPVHIKVEEPSVWASHRAKRRNLYERHLGIPLAFLRGRTVLCFGCNSGENELVLAQAGAHLTLVEPNEQVHPRLRGLFQRFGLEHQLVALQRAGVEDYPSDQSFDLVLAEGFLNTLPNRDELLLKISSLVKPGGFGVISFVDRYGSLLEMTRRMILWRSCQLAGIDDLLSGRCLDLARRLYAEDFARLPASRAFETWWKDTLVNPFVAPNYLWSYPELLALHDRAGCQFHSSSPRWSLVDHFGWYKNCDTTATRHARVLDDFRRMLPFFLTGLPAAGRDHPAAASDGVLGAVAGLIAEAGEFALDLAAPIDRVAYCTVLDTYLRDGTGPRWRQFAGEMKGLFEAAHGPGLDSLVEAYARAECVRGLWGVPYHYLCFTRPAE
jgi:SAM-dependent methyltransferase